MNSGKKPGFNFIIVLFTVALFLLGFKFDQSRVSVHLESKRLHKGKVITTVADLYFRNSDGGLVIHYTKPNDYIFITNSIGEAKVYYPEKNEVILYQNEMFSSENDILYTFLSNRHSDMGLKEGGFVLTSSKRTENSYVVTSWIPQSVKSNNISKIELVHENYLPIYMAFYGQDGKITKKTYYSAYYNNSGSPFPTQIVDIDYLPKNDSIVSRRRYSEIKVNGEATSPYFNFTIPANAKLVKLKPQSNNK